jgi:hypothetical protein
MAHLDEFALGGGGQIEDLQICHVTHGGFALNRHQLDHLIGPGRPLDTDKPGATRTRDELESKASSCKP